MVALATKLTNQKTERRKVNMSVEAITDAILEYTYDKLNDSPETEEEKTRAACAVKESA